MGTEDCKANASDEGWTRDPRRLRKEEVGLQGKLFILCLRRLRGPCFLQRVQERGSQRRKMGEGDKRKSKRGTISSTGAWEGNRKGK